MSPVNIGLSVMFGLVAVLFFVDGNIVSGAIMTVCLVATIASVLWARSGSSGDVTRLNALEYSDERDRRLGVRGLAAVGVAGLSIGGGAFVAFVTLQVFDVAMSPFVHGVFLGLVLLVVVLCIVWSIANWIVARRG
ncbi:hypothetical protein [Brevibacterium litoralis]|uniref:hypothetical protein n=1 Tax=Brevibacterium litoralis TaxID=3138935 RepID=UPI0032ED4B71